MRLILLSILTGLTFFSAYAQSKESDTVEILPMSNGRIFYSEVDTVAATKDELYSRAKSFLSFVFPNFTNVVKMDDRDLGEVRVRGLFNTLDKSKKGMIISYWEFYAIVDIQVKEGRYKYQISEFTQSNGMYPFEATMYNQKRIIKMSKDLCPYMNNFILLLKNAMHGASEANNW